jgi:hypothetical protein
MKKRYNTYNPYARLPKAEAGMNVRGPRNQLAKQVSAEKNVGTWFKDAGKWLLNTLVSPIEGITQTNFYDPNFSHGGWEGFNDVFEGTHKGVGDALGYVYGGPMHAANKESGKGMMDAFGVEEQTRAIYKNGGRVLKAQDSLQVGGLNQGVNAPKMNSFNFDYDADDPAMATFDADLQNWISTTYGNGSQGTPGSTPYTYSVSGPDQGGVTPQGGSCVGGGCAGGGVKYASGMTKAEMANQEASKPIKTSAPMGGDGISRASDAHVQKYGNPYASDPNSDQGWSGTVQEAMMNPDDAIGNLVGSIRTAGQNAPDFKSWSDYEEQQAATGSHPGDLIGALGNIGAGMDPVMYAHTKKYEDSARNMQNAKKGVRGLGFKGMQYGGVMENPYLETSAIDASAKSQGGGNHTALRVGQGVKTTGGVVGESLSGMGMGGGGGAGMENIMGMFGGGGEGGSNSGGFIDMFGGGEGGGGFDWQSMMGSFMSQNGGRIPKAQMGGGLMDMLGKVPGMDMIQKLMGGLGGGGGQGGGQGGGGMDMSGMMEKMQNMDPEQWKAMQGMFKDGFSAEGLGNAIGGSAGEGIGGIVGGFMGGGGATKQNGGRLAKTSNLPMDMEGFTDLEQGFNRSNTIEINSGNNHSDLDNPHTPLNIPVPSFDEQGNAMTENVQILAEKGEFARKDPDTEAVTIFSKNLKTKDSSGKRTNYAKIAEKLGKKEERLTTQAKNPFDDIADASIQRALNNVKNKFIRLEEEQKVAKEVKEEEDRMDLMQLAKNGGRITKKNTYRVPGRKTSKILSEYQKDLLGMDDQGQMPMAQNGMDNFRREELWGLTPAERKAKRAELKVNAKKERETRRNLRELEQQQKVGESPSQTIEEESGIATDNYKPSDLAKQISEDLPEEKEFGSINLYPNTGVQKAAELLKEQARKQKQQEAEEDYEFYSNLSKTGGTPKTQEEEYSTAPEEEEYSTAPEEETGEQQPQQRGASGDSAINDYINNLRGINSEVEQSLTPYENYFEDYGRETEHIQRNAINDLPEWYMDRASQLASANVNSLENQIRNMGQSMGTSGYLAQMQAAKNKELAANQGYAAQAVGQREQQLGKIADTISRHRQVEAEGATVADDRTREAQDALYSARYDTEKNILTGRLAQTREDNAARRNELLDSQMQWMYNNDRTQYDEEGNPVNPDPAIKKGYGGSIKRDMYEYGSRVKRERQMKSDKAINEFRSFMRGFNKK